MHKLRIIADEKIPFLMGVLEPYAEMKYVPGNQITRELAMSADALFIRTRTHCDESFLKGSNIKFIATATIGFDHIDTEFCKLDDIRWANAPGCNSSSVQQYITAAFLRLAYKYDFNLGNKTLGIIGVGNVGSKVETAARLLGLQVKLNDPPRARTETNHIFVDLSEILETCDLISLHVPLNREGVDKTYHLFDHQLFDHMKEGAWLINSSRGEVVNTQALKDALTSGKLNGAILDVWENEPQIDIELLHNTYIGTPHVAGYSLDGKANGTAQAVNSLARFFGLPLSNYYPSSIPEPLFPEIRIDVSGKPYLQVVHEAVAHTYAIMKDHTRLQLSPETFEHQRSSYPMRREFPAYNVILINGKPEAGEILATLGFNVKMQ